MTDTKTQYSSAWDALADSLRQERGHILESWRAAAASSGEETLVETLSRGAFYDNIPGFLEHFCERLGGDSSATPARQHGAQRWQQGLNVAELLHEWGLLHRILLEKIGALWSSTGLAAKTLPRVYWLLAESVQQAIETSLGEYRARERAQAETRVRDLEAALAQHKDLDYARGQGLRHASHDLRGSLQTVQICCHLLQKQRLEDETRVIVDRLVYASESLNLLFSDLLDLSRLEAGREQRHLMDADVAEIFREMTEATQASAEAKSLELIARGNNSLIVRTDPAKLRRIAQNLVANALSYTPAGIVEIGWYADPPKRWTFYVQDSGPGMMLADDNPMASNLEQADQDGAKTPDFSHEQSFTGHVQSIGRQSREQGEGIGLAIVHELCELLDAVLEIDSKFGQGTTLRVQLPLNYDNASKPAP